jgi:hypothetical protein
MPQMPKPPLNMVAPDWTLLMMGRMSLIILEKEAAS